MKLYNFSWGPYPRRVTLYLAEKGIQRAIDLVEVEFPHKPELWPEGFLRSLNPNGSLPVLDTGKGGVMVRQSLAILEYLEETSSAAAGTPNMLGRNAEERARTRELVSVFDEATSFFGIWARQGSRLNADRHPPSKEAAAVGATRFAEKLRVAERMISSDGPLLTGNSVTIADVVAMALLEFTQDFYDVPIPRDCEKLTAWYRHFKTRPTTTRIAYPKTQHDLARDLPAQTGIAI